jgi:hypothetical protein
MTSRGGAGGVRASGVSQRRQRREEWREREAEGGFANLEFFRDLTVN